MLIEFIRDGYEAMNRGDFDAALARMHPRVVWENDPDGPEGSTRYVGRNQVRKFWEEFFGVWDRYRFEVLEVVEARSDLAVAHTLLKTWMRGADDPVSMHTTYLWTIRDNRAVRVCLYFNRDEGLKAAGLSD